MTEQEYKNVCAKIDAILADLGSEFSEDDPRIEQLLSLSDEADEYYKERHLCTNEFIVKRLEAFVNQH